MTAPGPRDGRGVAPTGGAAGRPPGGAAPATKAARQARIAAILSRERVRSQEELADLLARYGGTHVAQATLSRDLDELGVVRLRGPDGFLVYALPEEPGGPGSRPGAALDPDAETEWAASPGPASPASAAPPRSTQSTSINLLGAPVPEPSGEAAAGEPTAAPGGAQADVPDYRARSSRLARYLVELLTSAEASANLVVLRTPAGAAQFLASVIDHAVLPSILGTVAGDDTVLVITRDPAGGEAVAAEFLRLAERRR